MKLIGCGDSWAWGYELVDPAVQTTPISKIMDKDPFNIHLVPENKAYRYKHRYLNLIADKLNAELIDLSAPAISNQSISRRLIEWLAENDFLKNKTSDVFVSIGWTSPIRTEFYLPKEKRYYDYLPKPAYEKTTEGEFMKLYTECILSHKKSMLDYFSCVYNMECILKNLNIKYVMHQPFYDNEHWMKENDSFNCEDISENELKIWENIDSNRFIDKNETLYKKLFNDNYKKYMYKWHPNELGHKTMADHIYESCIRNNLL